MSANTVNQDSNRKYKNELLKRENELFNLSQQLKILQA